MDSTLRRLTVGDAEWFASDTSPDGQHLLMGHYEGAPALLSLYNGSIVPLPEQIGRYYTYGGAK
jgi:hypothetical protein